MNIYLQLLLLSAVVVYIVDLSGWTETWLGWLSKFTRRHGYGPVTSLRPFSCSQCMTWWCTLAWCLIFDRLDIVLVAYCAGLAFFSITLHEVLIFLREGLLYILGRLNGLWMND